MSEAIKFLQAFADDKRSVQAKRKDFNDSAYFIPENEQDLLGILSDNDFIVRMTPKPFKPDLSCLVGSDIVCEFWDGEYNPPETVGKLSSIEVSSDPYWLSNMSQWQHCQPALDLWQVHMGGECPLPEGATFQIRVAILVDGDVITSTSPLVYTVGAPDVTWEHDSTSVPIISYCFKGWAE